MSEAATVTPTPTPAVEAPALPEDFNEYEATRRAQDRGEEPPAKPAETPSEAPAEPPKGEETPEAKTAAEPETEEEEEQEEGAEEKPEHPRKKGGFQKRIDKLTREKRELEARIEALERGSAEKPAGSAPEKPEDKTPKPAPEGKPKVEDFDTYEEFTEALTDWKLEQREKQRAETQSRTAAESAYREQAKTYAQAEAQARKAHDDYDEVLEGVEDVRLPAHVEQAIFEDPQGPELAYYLAGNREDLERIVGLPPIAAVREIGKISARLTPPEKPASGDKPKPSEPKPKVTSAPKPIVPVGGAASGGTPSIHDESLASDYASWEKQRRAQIKGR